MATNQELAAAVAALNVATSKSADGLTVVATAFDAASIRIAALMAKVSEQMTAEEIAAFKATIDAETNRIDQGVALLEAHAAALDGLAADPVVPVPIPVPEPTEPPTTPVEN